MALDAIILLESLHCIREVDLVGFEGSEPYVWPVVIRIDDLTLQTPALVEVVAPLSGSARVVVKDSMRAGQSAEIPASVGLLRTRLEDNLFETRLILIVALWDGDQTPAAAVRAGFQAFVAELGAAIGDGPTLLALLDAENRKDEAARQAIVKTIQDRVNLRVETAISSSLTGPQKVAVKTGFLNLDDVLGSAFRGFASALPTAYALRLGKGTLNEFEIRGRLDIREVRVDRCQAQVDLVKNAQAVVDDVKAEIKRLQDDLKRASPGEKPVILEQIEQLRAEDLPIAEASLGRALTSLSICRARTPRDFPTEAEPATR